MTIAAGARLGTYVIDTLLGTGGMGEVYRAHDTRLKRDVALKILPAASAADPDRLARFQREAQVLASLDHPHIGAIYGIEEGQVGPAETGHYVTALVLQLVEGDTLAERIARGAIPPDEALPIARQIAEALEAAHEQGVIHRDLKPANVKITPDGQVKVLDFGLAKLSEAGGAADSGRSNARDAATMSPTITTPALMTGVGVILGTAAYMSPEQAKGRSADKRSDIWAFGCVVYEMLIGRRAFDGDDVAETLAAVIRGEPEWNALPAELPTAVSTVIRRCVVKDRRERISDIAAVLFVLRESSGLSRSLSGASAAPASSRWRTAVSYLVVAVVVAVLTSVAWWFLRPSVQSPPVTRFTLTMPDDARLIATVQKVVAISRDGKNVAYQTNRGVHVRSIATADVTVVQTGGLNPVFSPDGESLVFYANPERALRRVSLSGGSPITLCEVADTPSGISWEGEHIVYGQGESGILRVSQDGGKPEVLVKPQPGESAVGPSILPDGDTLLYTVAPKETGTQAWTWDQARIVVQSLTSGRQATLVEGASDARYVATGHLLYAIAGILFAQPFNLRRWELTGARVAVVDGVRRGGTAGGTTQSTRLFNPAQLVVSENGTLVYVPGPSSPSVFRAQLVVADRSGTVVPLMLPPARYQFPRSSPDGRQIAYAIDDGKDATVWVYTLDGSTSPRRLTFEGRNRFPIWSGDGQWVAFQSDRDGERAIYRQRADGTSGKSEQLTRPESGVEHAPESWSPDGKSLLFSSTKGSAVTLQILSLTDGTVRPFPRIESDRWPNAVFSPDGHHIAYSIRGRNESGNTLYVEPFPPTGQKDQIATGDAHMPVWSRDGRELLFADAARPDNGRVGFSRVTIDRRRGFTVSPPTLVTRRFNITAPGIERPRTFDILPDGRFVGVMDEDQARAEAPRIEVVVNWTEELKRLVAH